MQQSHTWSKEPSTSRLRRDLFRGWDYAQSNALCNVQSNELRKAMRILHWFAMRIVEGGGREEGIEGVTRRRRRELGYESVPWYRGVLVLPGYRGVLVLLVAMHYKNSTKIRTNMYRTKYNYVSYCARTDHNVLVLTCFCGAVQLYFFQCSNKNRKRFHYVT